MLTLLAGQAGSLWDEALPVEVRELPQDLAGLDRVLADPGLLAPIVAHWRREVAETRRAVLTADQGRLGGHEAWQSIGVHLVGDLD